MPHVVVGTAGHIDHGKSTLVRALTGTDPDRLPEEKRRGITTDLGYAFLDDVAAIIDVPGHERLVHNMVTGAATIDFGLLVVAADDGVMPQTTEHLQILKFLGVRSGAVVISKCDAADPDWVDLVEEQIRGITKETFLEAAPIFRLDSLSGTGLQEFRAELIQLLKNIAQRSASGVFRLPVDRVFAMKGRGMVVTGTILAGQVHENARLVALPGGLDVRVKHLETHGQSVAILQAGQRAALNLVGETEKLVRGMTLTAEGSLLESQRLLVSLQRLATTGPLKNRQRIRLLLGTQEVIGRIIVLSDENSPQTLAHLVLEEPVVACWHDRFVLRRYSPVETLAGGTVLDPVAPRVRVHEASSEAAFAQRILTADLPAAILAFIEQRGANGITEQWLSACFGMTGEELAAQISGKLAAHICRIGEYLLTRERLEDLGRRAEAILTELHRSVPDSPGFQSNEIKSRLGMNLPDVVVSHVIKELETAGKVIREQAFVQLAGHSMLLTTTQSEFNARVLSELVKGGFAPPAAQVIAEKIGSTRTEVEKALVQLEKLGQCRRLSVDLFFSSEQFEHAISAVKQIIGERSELSISETTALLKSSRKYVVPFLEFLDNQGLTMRDGNMRRRGLKFKSE
jgi:selenocysteine-specific elongation factor